MICIKARDELEMEDDQINSYLIFVSLAGQQYWKVWDI